MAGSIALGIACVIFGSIGVWWGLKRRKPYELITETPTTAIGQLSDPGIVELKGEIRASDDLAAPTFQSPIGQTDDAVLAAWRVEEWSESGDHSRWKTVAAGVRSNDFEVDDGTGSVSVSVGDHVDSGGLLTGARSPKASDGVSFGDVVCEFDRFPVALEVGVDDRPPNHVQQFVRTMPGVGPQSGGMLSALDFGNKHGDRRYYERTLHPGDEVYVLGRAYPRSEDVPRPLRPERMVVTHPQGNDDGMLIVSNEREQDLVRQTRYHLLGLVGGGLAVLAGVFLIGTAL